MLSLLRQRQHWQQKPLASSRPRAPALALSKNKLGSLCVVRTAKLLALTVVCLCILPQGRGRPRAGSAEQLKQHIAEDILQQLPRLPPPKLAPGVPLHRPLPTATNRRVAQHSRSIREAATPEQRACWAPSKQQCDDPASDYSLFRAARPPPARLQLHDAPSLQGILPANFEATVQQLQQQHPGQWGTPGSIVCVGQAVTALKVQRASSMPSISLPALKEAHTQALFERRRQQLRAEGVDFTRSRWEKKEAFHCTACHWGHLYHGDIVEQSFWRLQVAVDGASP